MRTLRQHKVAYLFVILLVVSLGLISRSKFFSAFTPSVTREYGGDVLWALMAYLLICLVAPNFPVKWTALATIILSFSIEISQLYQASWINAVRQTAIGGLLLGRGFLWSDMICYLIGISIGALAEIAAKTFVRIKS